MRLRLAMLVVCAFALLAAPARADHGPTDADPTLASYMSIAATYWGGPEPACTTAGGQVIHPHAVLANNPRPDVAAWAEVGGCRIWVDTDYWPAPPSEAHCNLIVHEWGHLLGHEHSSDPKDLMWPEWTNLVVPGCQVFRPPPRAASTARGDVAKLKRLRAKKSRRRARRSCSWSSRHNRRFHMSRAKRRAHRRACLRRSKRAASTSRLSAGTIAPLAAEGPSVFRRYHCPWTVLGGELAVPYTRNPL